MRVERCTQQMALLFKMASSGDTNFKVKDLIAKKDAIEVEIKELMSVLESVRISIVTRYKFDNYDEVG